MPFAALGLAEPIRRALAETRYATPTPIQSAAIPAILACGDLIGIAQTGTGKTAAFALPILHRLSATPARVAPRRCRVLVLSPTRELSGQIANAFTTYGRHLRVSVALAIGGVPIGRQMRAVAGGVDIVVATPGRLLDLCTTRALDIGHVDVLVLDEADRMLDMGFVRDIRRIVAMLPPTRQTLLFSATMPPEIAKLAGEMLTAPSTVSVAPPSTTAERIEQRVVHVGRAGKPDAISDILKAEPVERALVFTRTKHGADRLVRGLAKSGIVAAAIHGDKSQRQREKALAAFRAGRVVHLVATDIAARGIDVAGISHVINYDLPNMPETYVHRIGRTARAGKAGVAISLCSADERPFLRSIEQLIRQTIPSNGAGPVEREEPPPKPSGKGPRATRGKRRGPGKSHRPRPPYRGDDISTAAFMRAPARSAQP